MDLARTVHPRGEELRRAELALEYSDPHADGVLRAGGRFRSALPRLWVQSLAVDRPRRAPSHRRHPGCPMIGSVLKSSRTTTQAPVTVTDEARIAGRTGIHGAFPCDEAVDRSLREPTMRRGNRHPFRAGGGHTCLGLAA